MQPNYKYLYTTAYCDSTLPSSESSDVNMSMSVLEFKVKENPIGSLQEMCTIKRLPPPLYKVEQVEGMPHTRMFTISCNILSYCATGNGQTKKQAKKKAAHKMYQMLQEISNEADEIQQSKTNEPLTTEILEKRYSSLKDYRVDNIANNMPFAYKLVKFEMYLRQSDSEKLDELQRTSLDSTFNCIHFLQELAKELEFETTYVDVDEKSANGRYQCLLQICTVPLVICFGTGKTTKEAQMSAAFNALEYLKVTSRK